MNAARTAGTTGAAEVTAAIHLVMSARDARELFGTTAPAREFRRLAKLLHPDHLSAHRLPAVDQPRATAAFIRLASLWRDGEGVVIRTSDAEYRLGAPAYAGDLADLYDVGADRLLKLPRQPANNDLMEREARALWLLAEQGDPRYLPYVPRLVDSFRHRELATGAQRLVNVVAAAPGLHSLVEVRQAYPDGVDARDAAWMWRRLLVALGFAHRAGLVHGAVLPGHVLIEPAAHGVVLVDWCYSVVRDAAVEAVGDRGLGKDLGRGPDVGRGEGGERIPAMVASYVDWYPPEVSEGRQPEPGTDIAMASRCMTWLMGECAPQALRRFAAGCVLPSRRQRPDDAWRLLAELDEHLADLYGPRKFRPFAL